MYTLKGFALPSPTYLRPPKRGLRVGGSGFAQAGLKLPQPPAYPPGIPDAVQPDVSIFYLNSIMTQPLDGGGNKFLVDSRGFQ